MRSLALISALLATLLIAAAPCAAAGDWTWPVRGPVLTEFRNGDDPYAAGQHRGVDIGAPVGASVVAASGGSVVFAGVVGSSGLVVSERTGDGRYELSYLHLSELAVRRGDVVERGERVGAVGVSGSRSVEQPHLHFGVRDSGDRHAYLDPLDFLAPLRPVDAPAPVPAPAPVTVREPAPSGPADAPVLVAPSPAPAPVPHGSGRVAHGQPHVALPMRRPAHPVALPQQHASTAPHALPGAHPQHGSSPRPSPLPGHGPAEAPVRAGATHSAAAQPHPIRRHDGGGIDAGWLAACAGLVIAAALLAAPRRGRSQRPTARHTFATLIRAVSRA